MLLASCICIYIYIKIYIYIYIYIYIKIYTIYIHTLYVVKCFLLVVLTLLTLLTLLINLSYSRYFGTHVTHATNLHHLLKLIYIYIYIYIHTYIYYKQPEPDEALLPQEYLAGPFVYHTRTHIETHTHTHTCMQKHTHTHTHMQTPRTPPSSPDARRGIDVEKGPAGGEGRAVRSLLSVPTDEEGGVIRGVRPNNMASDKTHTLPASVFVRGSHVDARPRPDFCHWRR